MHFIFLFVVVVVVVVFYFCVFVFVSVLWWRGGATLTDCRVATELRCVALDHPLQLC